MASKRDLVIKKRRVSSTPDPLETEKAPNEKAEGAAVPAANKSAKRHTKKRGGHRRRHGRSAVWVVLLRLSVITAILVLGVLVWQNRDSLAPAAVTEWFERVVTGGSKGDGYPVDIGGDRVVSMQPFGNQMAVLTDTALQLYNSTASQTADRAHTYADPLLRVKDDYMLVAELGGTRYTLHTKKESIFDGKVNYPILGAAVSANGQVAVATESSQSYRSEVVVFDRKGKKVFHWYSADLTVIDVTFHPRQKQIAVLGLSASNGEMRSTVQVFSLGGKETGALHTYSATGPMMTALRYFDNERLGVVGDTAVWVYDPAKNTTAVTAFEEAVLLGYAFAPDGVGIVTRDYGEVCGGVMQHISATGDVACAVAFDSNYRHVAVADNGFYLLTESTAYLVNKGTVTKQTAVSTDSLMVAEMNGKPLVLGLSMLTRVAWES